MATTTMSANLTAVRTSAVCSRYGAPSQQQSSGRPQGRLVFSSSLAIAEQRSQWLAGRPLFSGASTALRQPQILSNRDGSLRRPVVSAALNALAGKDPKDVTVAVVGSTGYIGKFVTKELVSRGFNVIAGALPIYPAMDVRSPPVPFSAHGGKRLGQAACCELIDESCAARG